MFAIVLTLGVAGVLMAWIMTRGWSERRQAFVQSEDSEVLDASLLPSLVLPHADGRASAQVIRASATGDPVASLAPQLHALLAPR